MATTAQPLTRSEKTEGAKRIIKELLALKPMKYNELLEEATSRYIKEYEGGDESKRTGAKGRIGSDIQRMQESSEVMEDGGMYALKARLPSPPKKKTTVKKTEEKKEEPTDKPVKKQAAKTKKAAEVKGEEPVEREEKIEPAPKKRGRKAKGAEPTPVENTEKKLSPVEGKPDPAENTEEKPAPKKRGRKPKAEQPQPITEKVEEPKAETPKAEELPRVENAENLEQKAVETKAEPIAEPPAPVEIPVAEPKEPTVEKTEEPKAEKKGELIVKPKGELAKQDNVRDISFLVGERLTKVKPEVKVEEKRGGMVEMKAKTPAPAPVQKAEEKPAVKAENKPITQETAQKPVVKEAAKFETKPVQKQETKPAAKTETKSQQPQRNLRAKQQQPLTEDEKLRKKFIEKMRTLGGEYFEYYSVYLLERYCMKYGQRLEGLQIIGGDHDGGIDGEIVLTNGAGFRETIYVQAKNWDPERIGGDPEKWIIGETTVQQFIGACETRKCMTGKQNARGIFITTSRFHPDAKRILNVMQDRFVGYDENDLYEAAKECSFGLVKENGVWKLDEKLLSGTKAFFHML